MSSYVVRKATPSDIPAMVAIESSLPMAAHWPASEYARIFEPGCAMRLALVIESACQVCGFLVARCISSEWELENVAVASSSQRRGLGRELLRNFVEIAGRNSVSKIFLEVRESNVAARQLYSQFGFRESGRRPDYYPHPIENAVVYELLLKDN